jgi:dipeptidyl aminopeptidase/acylaminoacyl peptidase
MHRVSPKWKDEAYSNIHWGKTPNELRFVRRDRLKRHVEFCSMAIPAGPANCLLADGFENAGVDTQPVRYLDDSDEMIWWSEHTGWGHFYLYGRDGTFKNAITAGAFRADRIVNIDAKTRTMYFTGNAREPGENVYYQHLYSVKLDGTGLTLLDPGNATHTSILSPSFKYLVDNSSRVDQRPASVLRDSTGKKIADLEQADLSRLIEVGWKMPETFVVKAADGVTDLYGDMWKPFDFDPNKKYPIIANVYPGPQQEGVTHTFSALSGNQQLAQLGFIVIQVGHRGGTPNRSKAYASFGYFNLRDYGLADKKTAIEQLAARHPFIDINRVGIYGHSGGGFMSAAAVLQKPYNEFFKAAVASSGNHDNNIYGDYWAERYHGLKVVPVASETPKKDDKKDGKTTTAANPDSKKDGASPSIASIPQVKFEIKVPTNAELAANLKGALLLVHGEADNNVHPANTMRLVDALIKANKRFDMLILPGKRHAYADYQPYFTQRMWDFFAEHLLNDRQTGADILDKHSRGSK